VTRPISALLIAVAAAVVGGSATPASAIEYPWCAQYVGGAAGGGRNCGYVSYAQCMETVRGMGGFCEHNLFYAAESGRHGKRLRKYNHDE
jgi:hypothetical protein